MKNFTVLILAGIFIGSGAVRAAEDTKVTKQTDAKQAEVKQLEQRLNELEQKQKTFEKWYTDFYSQAEGRVTPYLGEKISFGGFFESAFTSMSGPSMQTQNTVNTHSLGLNIAADFTENIRFITQYATNLSYVTVNTNNNPKLVPSTRVVAAPSVLSLLAQAYIEIRKSDAFQVQTGLGYAPFGYAFQQREPVLFRRRTGPQMLNSADAGNVGVAFPLWMGVHILGSFPTDDGRWGYNVYTISPSTNMKSIGVGTRVWREVSDNTTFGISLQEGQLANDLYYSYGADLDWKYGSSGGVLVEFARNEVISANPTPLSYYMEPYLNLKDGKYVVYVSADYLESKGRMVGAVSDAFQKWQFGGGLNWLPVPNARFRLGYTNTQYEGDTAVINGQRREYASIDLSAGMAF